MKRSDLIALGAVVAVLLPFFLSPAAFETYRTLNHDYGYTASFIKFAILATFGESLGLRIRTGNYWQRGFGLIPRAIVWGILGITIKMAFIIFGEGGPVILKTLGVNFPDAVPSMIFLQTQFSWLKLLAAFSVGVTLNLFFAPVFMATHRITDLHIQNTGGSIKGFFTPIPVRKYITEMDWAIFWSFILKKTVPLFWIPAQTLNFMLPEEFRILVAALYSIILGVLLSVASTLQMRRL
jgi:hypothetical protein